MALSYSFRVISITAGPFACSMQNDYSICSWVAETQIRFKLFTVVLHISSLVLCPGKTSGVSYYLSFPG